MAGCRHGGGTCPHPSGSPHPHSDNGLPGPDTLLAQVWLHLSSQPPSSLQGHFSNDTKPRSYHKSAVIGVLMSQAAAPAHGTSHNHGVYSSMNEINGSWELEMATCPIKAYQFPYHSSLRTVSNCFLNDPSSPLHSFASQAHGGEKCIPVLAQIV